MSWSRLHIVGFMFLVVFGNQATDYGSYLRVCPLGAVQKSCGDVLGVLSVNQLDLR